MTTFKRRASSKCATIERNTLALAALVALAACSSSTDLPAASPRVPSTSRAAAASTPSLDPALARRIERAAGGGDEAALFLLGREVGARALLTAVADDAHRRTALLALPHAVDAETVLDVLAERAGKTAQDDEAVLEAIARVVAEPGFDELLAPEALVRCHRRLRELAVDATRSPEARALAETAYRRLEEYARGRVSFGSER